MPHCPQQHVSESDDFCSVCGLALEPAAAAPLPCPEPAGPPTAGELCPVCRTPRGGHASAFCEECGCHFELATTGVTSVLAASAEVPDACAPAELPTPTPTRTPRWDLEARAIGEEAPAALRDAVRIFPLDLDDQLIGRRSARRGIEPEIALDDDDGVSHRHARLRRDARGGFELIDLASANGTLCNGASVPPQMPLPLHDGDRLQLGRWTELQLRQR